MLRFNKINVFSILLISALAAGDEYSARVIRFLPPPAPVRSIAEFEQMEGVLIRYPVQVTPELAREMAEEVILYCLVDSNKVFEANTYFSDAGVDTSRITFITFTINTPYLQPWTRDYGPWWITDGEKRISIIDFTYSDSTTDNVPLSAADFFQVSSFTMDISHVGGNYMTDGMGISVSTDLVLKQNKQFTQSQINDTLDKYLGIETCHIMKDSLSIPLGHIDCWAKFLAVDKILILSVPNNHTDFEALEKAADYFNNQVSSYGTRYKVYRVFVSGQDLEAYTNSLILNKKVLVPLSNTVNDSNALKVYREAMPGYEVMGFTGPAPAGWLPYDAIHCRTSGIPDRGMLYAGHMPLHDTVIDSGDGYPVNAEIISYSKKPLIDDSLSVYWKTAEMKNFNKSIMNRLSADSFKATIPSQKKSVRIGYYIHAADESGRNVSHPFIGAFDPHLFYGYYKTASISSWHTFQDLKYRYYQDPFRRKIIFMVTQSEVHGNTALSLFNNKGQLIRTWSTNMPEYSILWDGTTREGKTVSAGIYFYRIVNGGYSISGCVPLLK